MEGELHLTRELLEAHENGTVSMEEVLRVLLGHLERCEGCGDELTKWREERRGSDPASPFVSVLARGRHGASEAERRRAKRELNELLAVRSVAERLRRIQRANKRFRSPYLAELLIYESWDELMLNAGVALELVEMAVLVLTRCPAGGRVSELRVLALAGKAAAHKALGDLEAAGRLYATSRALAEQIGLSDLLISAHLDRLEGSYLTDRRRLEEARQLLAKALRHYELVGRDAWAARTKLLLSLCLYHLGRCGEAIALTREAAAGIEREDEPILHLSALHNEPLFLVRAGRHEEAGRLLHANLSTYREMARRSPLVGGHFHWLAGKVKRGLRDSNGALAHLETARDIFLDQGTRYEVVMICLDLALLHLETGDTAEVRELVGVMLPSYAADGLHREALAAVRLLEQSLEREALTSALVRRTYRYLEFAQADPSLSLAQFRVRQGR